MTDSSAGFRHAGALAAVALVVTWSSGFIGAELTHRVGAAPASVLFWRFVVLSVLLGIAALVLRRQRPSAAAWRRQAVLALLCQVAYLTLVFNGVALGVHGGTAALIAALQPMLVGTVAGRVLGESITAAQWLGMVLGLLGVLVVVSGDVAISGVPGWVYLLPAAGMLCLGTGTVLTRLWRPPEDLFDSIFCQSVVTAVALGIVALATGNAAPRADTGFWSAVAWLVGLSSLGGYVLYVFVTRTQGATVVSTLLYLTPPTTMLWAFLMFGVPVPPVALVGMAISALGVALVLRSPRRPETG